MPWPCPRLLVPMSTKETRPSSLLESLTSKEKRKGPERTSTMACHWTIRSLIASASLVNLMGVWDVCKFEAFGSKEQKLNEFRLMNWWTNWKVGFQRLSTSVKCVSPTSTSKWSDAGTMEPLPKVPLKANDHHNDNKTGLRIVPLAGH